ncbi:hypothetical protein [Haliangium sp.]|uniref:hypothetical protein n=1 Tax=Haliangium sp. TaxID=2663208 RepID=UPI003D12020C
MTSTSKVSFSDIVATLLRSITIARIKSDIFSSKASVEYLHDANLQNYPVPRVEIREADVDMKFTVIETADKAIDADRVMHEVVVAAVPGYLEGVMAVAVKASQSSPSALPLGEHVRAAVRTQLGYPPPPAELDDVQEQALSQAVAAVRDHMATRLVPIMWENRYLYSERLVDRPQYFGVGSVKPWTREVAGEVLSSHGITVWLDDPDFLRALERVAIDWSVATHEAVLRAVALAEAEFFDLDLAVKRDQLEYVPEHVMSSVKLSFVVENYEWTTTQDKQGNLVRKLTRK